MIQLFAITLNRHKNLLKIKQIIFKECLHFSDNKNHLQINWVFMIILLRKNLINILIQVIQKNQSNLYSSFTMVVWKSCQKTLINLKFDVGVNYAFTLLQQYTKISFTSLNVNPFFTLQYFLDVSASNKHIPTLSKENKLATKK